MNTPIFDHIVSLGANCDVTWQLRRAGLFQTSSPFDWLVTSFEGLLAVLQDDGERLGQEFFATEGGLGAACGQYKIVYWHEFPRRPDNHHVVFSNAAIHSCRDKLRHKMGRLIALCETGGCILFIRFGTKTNVPYDRFADGAVLTSDDLNALVGTIEMRFPRLAFSILFVEPEGGSRADLSLKLDPRISAVLLPSLPAPPGEPIPRAPDHAWDQLFARIPYRNAGLPEHPPESGWAY